MKDFFKIIAIFSVMGISFFYTEKTIKVVKEMDDIMIEIENNKENYSEEAISALIDGDTIIPGISGISVDVDSSYSKMRRFGKYDKSLIVTHKVKPDISIKDNYDKFVISGNKTKREVSFIFLATGNTDINKLLNILKKTPGAIFIDFNFYTKEKVENIKSFNHEIGNLSLNKDYKDSSFAWLTSKIKKVAKTTYCYDDNYNTDTLNICAASKLYTIHPSIIVSDKPLYDVKKGIENGSIIAFNINSTTLMELKSIIEYTNSKGFDIVSLDKLLTE